MRLNLRWCLLVVSLCTAVASARADDDDEDFSRRSPRQSPQEVTRARSDADAAYQRGDYPRVIELTNMLIASFPEDNAHFAYHLRASARIELGRASRSGQQIRQGIDDAREAILLAGARYRWVYIPYIYGLTTLAEVERRPEIADTGIRIATDVLRQPDGPEFSVDDRSNIQYQRGLAYVAKREMRKAVADFADAIKNAPSHLSAHLKRAETLAALGQMKDARAAFDESVSQFPSQPIVFNERGSFLRSQSDFDGAIADFTRCLDLNASFAVAYVNRASCLLDQDNPAAAEEDASAVLRLKPAANLMPVIYRTRGLSRLSQGNARGAHSDFTAASRAAPQDAQHLEDRGVASFAQDDFTAAAADFSRSLTLNPKASHLVPWLWLALSRAGKQAEASLALEKQAKSPMASSAWNGRVCAYLAGQIAEPELLEEAQKSAETIRRVRLCEAHFFIGQKLRIGEQPGAADHFREAVATKAHALSAYRLARIAAGDLARQPAAEATR